MNTKRRNFIVRRILKEELKKYLKKQVKLNEVTGLLPRNVKKEALHDVLGIPRDKLVDDYSVGDLVTKQKSAINSGKIQYQTMIRRLNWAQILNKTKNPDVTKKFRQVISKLHDIYKQK